MTIILETNKSTFERIASGELTFVVSKFKRPVVVGDTLVFQEVDEMDKHTEREMLFVISQVESEGVKTGYHAVAFKEKE